jgi:hypothetical protein
MESVTGKPITKESREGVPVGSREEEANTPSIHRRGLDFY